MEFKQVTDFKIDTGDGNTISGYGSIFGNVDLGGDIVMQGAFTKSLASGRKIKMLFQHDPDEIVGVWTVVAEDEKGVRVEGFFANTPRGQEMKELVTIGAIEGLSIGYITHDADYDAKGVRRIKEAELWEISIVTFPMNEAANITGIKAADMTVTEFEKALRTKMGLSRSEAKSVVARGYKGLIDEDQREAEEIVDETTNNETKTKEDSELEAKRLAELEIEEKQMAELKELINKTQWLK